MYCWLVMLFFLRSKNCNKTCWLVKKSGWLKHLTHLNVKCFANCWSLFCQKLETFLCIKLLISAVWVVRRDFESCVKVKINVLLCVCLLRVYCFAHVRRYVIKIVPLITGEPLHLLALNLACRLVMTSTRPEKCWGHQLKGQGHSCVYLFL